MTDMPPIGEAVLPDDEIEHRVAVLEAEVRALRSKVVEIGTHGVRKQVPRPLESQVKISTPTPVSIFKMPSTDELTKLLDAVGKHFPALLSTEGPAFEGTESERRKQYRDQFEGAFLAIGNMRRMDHPNTKVYLSYHVELAETLLRRFGRSMPLRGNPFIAAALAHFDVPVSGIGRMHEGITVEVGLHEWTGRPATDAWRRILEGQVPREVAVSRRLQAPSPARVYAPGY